MSYKFLCISETLVLSVRTPTSEKVLANNLLSEASLYTAMFINFIGTLGGEPPHAGSIMFQKLLNREVRHPVKLNEVQEKKVTGGARSVSWYDLYKSAKSYQ